MCTVKRIEAQIQRAQKEIVEYQGWLNMNETNLYMVYGITGHDELHTFITSLNREIDRYEEELMDIMFAEELTI